jgi:transposase InsO family protein
MNVSRSGFYDYQKRVQHIGPASMPSVEEYTAIDIFNRSKGSYGSRRVSAQLKRSGFVVGRHKAKSIMKKCNLKVKSKKRFKVTTNSNHHRIVSPNLVRRSFTALAPNKLWLGDITYVWTKAGWLYLAVVLDLYARRVVGWSMGTRMTDDLVTSAFLMAALRRKPDEGCIFHSDRGSQYASGKLRKQLLRFGFMQSMSRKGDCWDNAPMERFFSSIKRERLSHCYFYNTDQARREILDYIVFYNYERLHSTLDYAPPMEVELAA